MNTLSIYDQVIDHFGSERALARALGISRAAVSMWDRKIPPLRAHQIEAITGGRFKAADINPKATAKPVGANEVAA